MNLLIPYYMVFRMLPKLIVFKHKILIFCQMTQLMDIFDDYLELKGYKRCRLDGSTILEERYLELNAKRYIAYFLSFCSDVIEWLTSMILNRILTFSHFQHGRMLNSKRHDRLFPIAELAV